MEKAIEIKYIDVKRRKITTSRKGKQSEGNKIVLWHLTVHSMVAVHRRFGGSCCLHYQVRCIFYPDGREKLETREALLSFVQNMGHWEASSPKFKPRLARTGLKQLELL